QAEDGIRDWSVTGVQTCALPISERKNDPSVYAPSRYRDICENRKGAQPHHYVPAAARHGLTLLHRSRDTERSTANSSGSISQGQIGRASCRERVRMSVETVVVTK